MTPSHAPSPPDLRLVDASLNRIAEGLRYLEDVSRFLLNDSAITGRLKTMRHSLVESDMAFQQRLLAARDAEGDVGVDLETSGQKAPRDLAASVVANARRVQEGLRTLEEYAKVTAVAPHLTPNKMAKARFSLYTIEKDLLGRLSRQDRARLVRGVYVIIDTEALRGRSHVAATRQAIKGGASVIQLRHKTRDLGDILPAARRMKTLCAAAGIPFIVNDYLDLAQAVGADGLHVGQTDLPVSILRRLAPLEMMLGCSVSDAAQARQAVAAGADHVAVGAIFPTPSKESVVTGIKSVREVKAAVDVPVVAIGGITVENIAQVKKAGAHAAAVINAVLGAPNPEKATRDLVQKFGGKHG